MAPHVPQFATFAIAACASAMPAQDADLRSRIDDALDLARPALIAHLKAAVRASTRPGELALLVLAAIHDGVSMDDGSLQKAIRKLAKARPNQTYDLALRLLVIEACPAFPDRLAIARKDARKLLRHRSRDGAFQYHERPSGWDLSNTQYGALGLRAARSLGIDIDDKVWLRLAREVGEQQAPDGGFCYTEARTSWNTYASMTAAGIAVLAVCRQALGDNHRRTGELDKRIANAWAWFANHRDVIGSAREHWCFYFHYGLERAAILCDVTEVGARDWYVEGARMLVEQQLSGGGWRSLHGGFPGHHLSGRKGDAVPTSFAILFLRRKFQKQAGPITQQVVRLVNIGPRSKQKDVELCARQLVARGKEAMVDVVKALRSEIEPRRRAAALALEGITGDRFGYDPSAGREANRRAVRRAELWFLQNRN